MNRGLLYIVSAPSGAGKTSLLSKLITSLGDVTVAISHTTRQPRAAEEHGKDYFFVDKQVFETHIAQGEFLEYANVFGNFYGTSRTSVDRLLQDGQDVVLEIDWQGARTVRELMPDAISIFIIPPSIEALQSRLSGRGQDSDKVIAARMQTAQEQISHYSEYDYLVVNDDFDVALNELKAIVVAARLTAKRQQVHYQLILQNLVGV